MTGGHCYDTIYESKMVATENVRGTGMDSGLIVAAVVISPVVIVTFLVIIVTLSNKLIDGVNARISDLKSEHTEFRRDLKEAFRRIELAYVTLNRTSEGLRSDFDSESKKVTELFGDIKSRLDKLESNHRFQ